MAKKNFLKKGLQNLLGRGSTEREDRPVIRAGEMDHLTQTSSSQTGLDPQGGRKTVKRKPGGYFTPSGHYVEAMDDTLGECVACRAEAERSGQPQKVNLVPSGPGGGGICPGCGLVHCSGHAAQDDDGNWWCEECRFDRQIEEAEKTVVGGVLDLIFGADDE